jgi:hypothetical protein
MSALHALEVADYTHSWSFVMGALEEGLSNDNLKAEALNLRGTFKSASSLFPVAPLILSPGS